MTTTPLKPTVYNPSDRELISVVKKSACIHFEISEDDLMNDRTAQIANVRFLCFWLITQNTNLKDHMVASIFNKTRSAVIYGVGLIDTHKNIYRQTLDNLRSIVKIANTFEKKYSWHIQPISTTN